MPNSISETDSPKNAIRVRASEEGFDAVGFSEAKLPEGAAEELEIFLSQGLHGDMEWMATTAERRADPNKLWDAARSVVTLGMNYAPAKEPLEALELKNSGAISVYAQGADYHDVLKRKLKRVAAWIATRYAADVKVFVDTAPIMEKPIAHASGIGWQGKHTNLVSREFGSWLFLGSIFTTLALEPDTAEEDHCGSCRNCLDICPTEAFLQPYRLDARRCISYLTIEYKGHIPAEFREAIGNRIYGCDDCLAVCPWNKFAKDSREMAFAPRAELVAPALANLAALNDADFRTLFRGSPIKRIGRDRFVRNVLIAIGNSGDPSLSASAEARLTDNSPLVRAMAVWALSRLSSSNEFSALAAEFAGGESDPDVIREWNRLPQNPARY